MRSCEELGALKVSTVELSERKEALDRAVEMKDKEKEVLP